MRIKNNSYRVEPIEPIEKLYNYTSNKNTNEDSRNKSKNKTTSNGTSLFQEMMNEYSKKE